VGGGTGDDDQGHEAEGVRDFVVKDLLPRYNFCCDMLKV